MVNPPLTGMPHSNQSSRVQVPPLENGDRLSRHEFERRYQAMPHLKKAELIEGVVYVPSPSRFRSHAQPHARLMTWLGVYQASTHGVELGDNPTVRLDLDNEPQPDAVLLIDRRAGGRSRLSEDDYIEGAPELIAEIAASSAAYDLHDKNGRIAAIASKSISSGRSLRINWTGLSCVKVNMCHWQRMQMAQFKVGCFQDYG